ncbi:haloacid dehalogenase type II [Cryobacterium sp. HLT2-28]|nr:haloacid dehalogenase type II [Cryobacterium sp. HLT2-28]
MRRPGELTMNKTPSVIVFDVNETLSDMSPLKTRFVDVGAPDYLARVWFAALLRDGFALAAAGGSAKFAVIGADVLREVLRDVALTRSLDDAVTHVMDGFAGLNLHPDIAEGIRTLKGAGFRLVTLSNGSAQVAHALLTKAEIREAFEFLLTVEDTTAWKPVRTAYNYAADASGVQPADMLLVAVHPWDIHGASRAGMRSAWLNRTAAVYPSYFTAPDYTVSTLNELASRLLT